MPRQTLIAPAASKDAIDAAVEAFVIDTGNIGQFEVENLTGPLTVRATSFLGGSSWSSAYRLTASDPSDTTLDLFVKTARGRNSDSMFKGEALGLTAMRRAARSALAVPKVFTYGDAGGGSFIHHGIHELYIWI